MDDFPLWRRVLIALVCLGGVAFAMPNLFYNQVENARDARAIVETGGALSAEQSGALEGWPEWAPSGLVNLGLDLRGGAYLLVEVAVSDVHNERLEGFWPGLRDRLREIRDQVGTVRRLGLENGELVVRISNEEALNTALAAARELTQPVVSLTGAGSRDFEVQASGDRLIITLSEAEKVATNNRTMEQSLEIIRRRVDESGTREPTIQRQGEERILIEVPGIGSAEELLELLGTTAKLTFHHVEDRTSQQNANPGAGNIILPSADEEGVFYIVKRRPEVTGEQLTDAQPGFDQNGAPSVNFRFNPAGARKFAQYSAQNVGNLFAVALDGEVITAPQIREAITGGSGQITGNFTVESSTRLAILLRAGALPAELTVLDQRTVGPELGQDSIDAGRIACIVAFAGVLVFMALSYGLFGIFANIALILNVTLVVALLSLIGATLTLPGIAGIVLTIGMAVDANVLIFERIREELRRAKFPGRAIQTGYEKALSAIIDANITTLLAAVILFVLGSGPVRGFAVTLGLGIVTSVFTAIFVTRLFVTIWFEMRRPKTVEI